MPRKPRRRPWRGGSIVWEEGRARVFWREGGRKRSKRLRADEDPQRFLARRVGGAPELGAAAPAGGPTLGELAVDWLARRRRTHRDARNDANRWKNHLEPRLGRLRPAEVDQGELRRLVENRLEHVSTTTVRLVLRLLSTFFSDLVDDGHAPVNPVKLLSRKLRRMVRPAHDPRTTPFLESLGDIRRVFLALPAGPIRLAFAIGALAGLRPGEVLALRWEHVDLDAGRIHVRERVKEGKLGPLKDDESRMVPIQAALAPALREAKLAAAGPLVIPPLRRHGRFLKPQTLWKALRAVRAAASPPLPAVTWYQATRHTYASQFVLGGGSLEALREHLGHSTVLVTERYAHLRPDLFKGERDRLKVDLSTPAGAVVKLRPSPGTDGTETAPAKRAHSQKGQ